MIAASDLDWTIVRPAPFKSSSNGRMQVHTAVPSDPSLTTVTRNEVAAFVIDLIETADH